MFFLVGFVMMGEWVLLWLVEIESDSFVIDFKKWYVIM